MDSVSDQLGIEVDEEADSFLRLVNFEGRINHLPAQLLQLLRPLGQLGVLGALGVQINLLHP